MFVCTKKVFVYSVTMYSHIRKHFSSQGLQSINFQCMYNEMCLLSIYVLFTYTLLCECDTFWSFLLYTNRWNSVVSMWGKCKNLENFSKMIIWIYGTFVYVCATLPSTWCKSCRSFVFSVVRLKWRHKTDIGLLVHKWLSLLRGRGVYGENMYKKM